MELRGDTYEFVFEEGKFDREALKTSPELLE